MILKLAEGKRWVYIDKVKRVFAEIKDEKDYLPELREHAMVFASYKDTKEGKEGKRKLWDILVIYEDETGKQIVTDDVVFLLNDEGKTIERLKSIERL